MIWRVAEAPTGRYRSFEQRSWPSATYQDGKTAAYITCDDAYEPSKVRSGKHGPLTVRVADWSSFNATGKQSGAWKWRKMKKQFDTLADAKSGAVSCIDANPDFIPKEQP